MAQINSQQPASGQMLRESGAVVNVADLNSAALGGFGFEVIDDTAAHAAPAGQCFVALHCLTDTVFAAFTATADAPITGTFVGATHDKGFWLFGKFTSITLTSGDVYAYRGLL